MKHHSHVHYTFRVSLWLMLVASIIAQSMIFARAQESDAPKLTLVIREDGFNGVYTLNGKAYAIENREWQDTFRTQIFRPDSSLLVESSKEAGIVSVLLPTGKLKIDVANPSSFSVEDTRTIQNFNQSDDCALIKQIVLAVFKERAREKPSLLGGFRVISMLLGE